MLLTTRVTYKGLGTFLPQIDEVKANKICPRSNASSGYFINEAVLCALGIVFHRRLFFTSIWAAFGSYSPPGLDLGLSASVLACLNGLAQAAIAEALIEQMWSSPGRRLFSIPIACRHLAVRLYDYCPCLWSWLLQDEFSLYPKGAVNCIIACFACIVSTGGGNWVGFL